MYVMVYFTYITRRKQNKLIDRKRPSIQQSKMGGCGGNYQLKYSKFFQLLICFNKIVMDEWTITEKANEF
jgi:hypothetical protein